MARVKMLNRHDPDRPPERPARSPLANHAIARIRIERECPVGKRNGVTKLPDERSPAHVRPNESADTHRLVPSAAALRAVSHRVSATFLIVVAHPPIHLPIDTSTALPNRVAWPNSGSSSFARAQRSQRLACFPLGSFDGRSLSRGDSGRTRRGSWFACAGRVRSPPAHASAPSCRPRSPHLILQIKNVLEAAIEPIGPQMRVRRCIDELSRDAHPLPALRTLPSST